MEDRHIHTKFCPHGSGDTLTQYVEVALEKKLTHITFTEHAPLPVNFIDPVPTKDSAMTWQNVEKYINEVIRIKKQFKNQISISCGFEVDYIEGFEKEIQSFLDTYGLYIEDSILSVHFLRLKTTDYMAIDYSSEYFKKLVSEFGSLENVYDNYIQTLQKSVDCELGIYKPKRIGHITLASKFQIDFPLTFSYGDKYKKLLATMKEKGYSLDFNSSGLRKELCLETYPSSHVLQQAIDYGIPLQFGSDAHVARDVGAYFDILEGMIQNVSHNEI